MRLSEKLKAEALYVERKLGESVICDRCQCTLATYAEECPEPFDACPGFVAIEAAKEEFNLGVR